MNSTPTEFFGQLPITAEAAPQGQIRAVVVIGGDRHTAHGATFAEAAANLRAALDGGAR